MTEQTKVLIYSRDYLLSLSHHTKPEPGIQSIFKDSLISSRPVNERRTEVPRTIERSRNLRAEPKRAEQFLTPRDAKSKWKTKGPISPEAATPSPQGRPVKRNVMSENKDKQAPNWRSPINKENVENAVKPSQPLSVCKVKPTVSAVPSAAQKPLATIPIKTPIVPSDIKQLEAAIAAPPSPAPKEVEEVIVNVVAASPETPVSSPAAKSAKKSPASASLLSPSVSRSPSSPQSGSPKIIDEHQLDQRQKQIDYGHQTLGYLRYRLLVPKDKRSRDDPRTPKKQQACSKRSWDGQIKKWRRDLHQWDPEDPVAFMAWLESDFVVQMIKNNLGSELLDLLEKIKERAAKFENSPAPSPSPSPAPLSRDIESDDHVGADLDKEKIARKLVF